MSSKLKEVIALKTKLETAFPFVSFSIESFDSGAVSFEVRFNERLLVVDYYPKYGFCVDEVDDEDGFNSGYKDCFDNVTDVEDKLRSILKLENY